MEIKVFTSTLLTNLWVALLLTPAQGMPPTLQTDLSNRNLRTLEKLVDIAQQNSAAIKEAKAELGLSSWADSAVLEITPSYSTGNFVEDREQFSESERSFSISLTLNPLQMLSAVQQRPALRAKLKEAIMQKRAEVVQAYIAYLQAKQAKAIAQYQMQPYQNQTAADADSVTAANELFIASSNERVALENLAAAVGHSPTALLNLLQ
ncbi:MAG: hypothetical protein HC851_24545 [Acaryochloris sp. RU_4_1]|nr:hypothetical protein [Acaryochloris sp. RU_4_1]